MTQAHRVIRPQSTSHGQSSESEPSLDSAPGEDAEPAPVALTGDDAADGSAVEGEAQETPESGEASAEKFSVAAEAEDESSADDLLVAFQDEDTYGDLADITKDLDDIPMADLLAELRDIRAMLPPEALLKREDAA